MPTRAPPAFTPPHAGAGRGLAVPGRGRARWLPAHAVQGGFVGLPVRAQFSATGRHGGARQDGCDSPTGQPGRAPRPPGAATRCAGRVARAVPCGLLAGAALCAHVGDRPAAGLQFRVDLLPRPAAIDSAQEQAAARRPGRRARGVSQTSPGPGRARCRPARSTARNAALDAELARYRAEIAAAKAANAAQPATAHDYNEAATRDLFIDLLLKEAGWALDQKRDREFEVQGMPNSTR